MDAVGSTQQRRMVEWAADAFTVAAVLLYLGSYFPTDLLLSATTTTGGDTASHYFTAQYLREVMLPSGSILGWAPGNFAGYPFFQFYFPLPFVLMAVVAPLCGLQVAFKLVSVLGIFLLPICCYAALRLIGFRFPCPGLGAVMTLPFLLMEANSMWGGNILSTLAGEFAYSIGLALMVLWVGTSFRGLQQGRWAVANGVLLALVGFSHGYTLLFAVALSAYYLLVLPNLRRNLAYFAVVHGLAFCLMGFWVIPLLGYSTFTTRYNFVWVIGSWTEILPPILWPCLVVASLFTLVVAARMVVGRPRTSFDHRLGLLWFIIVISFVFYLVAYRINVVDIRFLPFLQLFICVLAAVGLGAATCGRRGAWLVPPAVVLAMVLFVDPKVSSVPQWVAWNYSGFEAKPGWTAFTDLNRALEGNAADPRVAYEHAPEHNSVLGTVRAFESLPLFSGRSTLEGLYMQSSISSPFVFYLQSEISRASSCPLPDYHCASFGLETAAEHLRLFNAPEVILRSDQAIAAARDSPAFEHRHSFPPFEVFQVQDHDGRYVQPLLNHPVAYRGDDWKSVFFQWFKRPGSSSVPLVRVVTDEDLSGERFAVTVDEVPSELRLEPYAARPTVVEEINNQEIRIHTESPGHPLLIKISYHPRWRVEGADRVYLASPSFMLIFPDQNDVRLVFADPPMVRFGQLLTAAAWLVVLVAAVPPLRRRAKRAWQARVEAPDHLVSRLVLGFVHRLERSRRWWAPTLAATVLVLTGATLYLGQTKNPAQLFNQGMELFNQGDLESAETLFHEVMLAHPTATPAKQAAYFYAICAFKQERWGEAATRLENTLVRFPAAHYAAELKFHLGLSLRRSGDEAGARRWFEAVITTEAGSRWARLAAEELAGVPP